MTNLKQRLGKWMIVQGIKYAAVPKEHTTEVKVALNQPLDAVVEVEEEDNPQWTPEQHGNVIVVEPIMISQHRRGRL